MKCATAPAEVESAECLRGSEDRRMFRQVRIVGQWRQQLQIIIALQQLSAGVSVQRTAEILGYESVSSFIGMFRKALGSPPARYVRDSMRRPAD